METIFEAKCEIPIKKEQEIEKLLGLEFVKEYLDTDFYLKSVDERNLKMKFTSDGRMMVYQVVFEGGCFSIAGKQISEREKKSLVIKQPIETEINRRKRAYVLRKFNVKVDFDDMKQFPGRLFLEIHSSKKSDVLKAKVWVGEMLGGKDFIQVPYDQLLKKD